MLPTRIWIYSLQQNFTSNFAFFHTRTRCFILFLVCFIICFSDYLGRKHLHTSKNVMHSANNTTDLLWWLQEKQLCGFQQYTNPSCLNTIYIYYYHISMATSTLLPLHWKTHCGLEYNTNIIGFIYIMSTSGLPQNQKKPVWFTMQCKHLDYMSAFNSAQDKFRVINSVCKCLFMCLYPHICQWIFCVFLTACFRLLGSVHFLSSLLSYIGITQK